jgi:hypothetical protein
MHGGSRHSKSNGGKNRGNNSSNNNSGISSDRGDSIQSFRNQISQSRKDIQSLKDEMGDFRKSNNIDPFQVPVVEEEEEEEIDIFEVIEKPRSRSGRTSSGSSGDFTDPFNASGNMSGGSLDSNGRRRKKKTTAGKKEKERKSKKRDGGDKSSRQSRTIDEGSKRGSGTTTTTARPGSGRHLNRNHSDTQATKSSAAAKKKGKTVPPRSKSMDGFDFETPPTFGFGGSTTSFQDFPETDDDDDDLGTLGSADPFKNDVKKKDTTTTTTTTGDFDAFGNSSCSKEDFFDVAESAWGGDKSGHINYTVSPVALAPSKKERRPPKPTNSGSSEKDFFGDSIPPAPLHALQRQAIRPSYSGGPAGVKSGAVGGAAATAGRGAGGGNRRSSANNMNGWMSEMPGFVAQAHQQHDDDDDSTGSGFMLQVENKGDISPLTAFTKKPVRPVIQRRR